MRTIPILRRAACIVLFPILASSCGGGGAREVVVEEREEGYYAEVQDIDPKFLCAAAERGDSRSADALLENGADPDALCDTRGLYQKTGCTVFAVGLMITAPLAGKCWNPTTPPLFLAAKGGHSDVLRSLLAHGAKPGALYTALESGDYESVRVLLAYGTQPDSEMLIKAVERNQQEIVRLLLDCGANPGGGDIKGVRNAWDFARDNPVMRGILDRYLEKAKAGEWEKNCPTKEEV